MAIPNPRQGQLCILSWVGKGRELKNMESGIILGVISKKTLKKNRQTGKAFHYTSRLFIIRLFFALIK
jgi:hypothetical protein